MLVKKIKDTDIITIEKLSRNCFGLSNYSPVYLEGKLGVNYKDKISWYRTRRRFDKEGYVNKFSRKTISDSWSDYKYDSGCMYSRKEISGIPIATVDYWCETMIDPAPDKILSKINNDIILLGGTVYNLEGNDLVVFNDYVNSKINGNNI